MASETLAKIDRAYDVVSALCEGKREWLMSIPARPDHDPDLIIGDALLAARNEIARLTRELEEARELIRNLVDDEDAGLVWLGRRLVCAYCTAEGLYSVAHAADCPIIRARHAIAALRSERELVPPFPTSRPDEESAALRSGAQGEEDAVRRTWELAVQRAYGCLDYCGGYRGAELEAFHSGIKTVIRALEAGLDTVDTQTAALDRIGATLEAQGGGK